MENMGRPVYEEDQIVTMYDLNKFRAQCLFLYNILPWWRSRTRASAKATVVFIDELQDWVARGKPEVMVLPGNYKGNSGGGRG